MAPTSGRRCLLHTGSGPDLAAPLGTPSYHPCGVAPGTIALRADGPFQYPPHELHSSSRPRGRVLPGRADLVLRQLPERGAAGSRGPPSFDVEYVQEVGLRLSDAAFRSLTWGRRLHTGHEAQVEGAGQRGLGRQMPLRYWTRGPS